jgi:hypothetical protein
MEFRTRPQTFLARSLPLAMLFLGALPLFGAPAPDTRFEPLPIDGPVTHLALLEDGRHLLVASEQKNLVTVWDVQDQRQTQALPCASPRHILCRGDGAFVANYGHGTITEIMPSGTTWRVRRLFAEGDGVSHLSAPRGSRYQGDLLASCGGKIHLVHTKRGETRALCKGNLLAVAAASGDFVLLHNGIPWFLERRRLLDRKDKLVGLRRGVFIRGPYHVRQDDYWFCKDARLYAGMPPKPISENLGGVVVPDRKKPIFYVLKKDALEARAVSRRHPVTGTLAVAYPSAWTKPGGGEFCVPVAVTHGAHLYLYTPAPDGQSVWACRAPAPGTGGWASPKGADAVVAFPETADGFSLLPMSYDATTMALTEDGRTLFVAQESENQLAVWDVLSGKRVQTVSCGSPRFITCRGGKAYVANYSQGAVTAIAREAGRWRAVGSVTVGCDRVYYVSAPRGERFANWVLATGGKYPHGRAFLVDFNEETSRLTGQQYYLSLAAVSNTGAHAIHHVGLPAHQIHARGRMHAYPIAEYARGEALRKQRGQRPGGGPFMYQGPGPDLWYGEGRVFAGMPPSGVSRQIGIIAVPDLRAKRFYTVTADHVEARKLNKAADLLWRRKTTFPKGHKPYERLWWGGPRFCPPQAATLGSDICLFLPSADGKSILYRKLAAPAARDPAPEGAEGR